MISKEDVKEYLDKMLKLEHDMEKTYKDLSREVKDPELIKVFERLTQDENNHAKMITSLQTLLKKWET